MSLDDSWFSEPYDVTGSAFSLKIKAKLHDEQSKFQHIEIYETESYGRLMVFDGCVMLTTLDNFIYHEMMSHTALQSHPDPRDVLIIGGGDCGTLREVLKHNSVQRCVQVDIDERVTRVTEQFFPELCDSNTDPRAELLFEDGISYVSNCDAAKFDVVIIDSTDPVGQAARLFSHEFYTECQRITRSGGILVAQSESPLKQLELIKSMSNNMHSAGYSDTHTFEFPQSCYPTGWWSCTLAGKNNDLQNIRNLPEDITTKFYTTESHRGGLRLRPFIKAALEN